MPAPPIHRYEAVCRVCRNGLLITGFGISSEGIIRLECYCEECDKDGTLDVHVFQLIADATALDYEARTRQN